MSSLLRRRALLLAAAGLLVAAVAAVVVYEMVVKKPADVSHPDAPFKPPKAAKPKPARKVDTFTWPRYGFTKTHIRAFDAPPSLRPPFRQVWRLRGETLLEFPPTLKGDRLYQLNDGGTLRAMSKSTGRVVWRRHLGHLAASTPAIDGTRVFATLLERQGGASGAVFALDARSGRTLWSKKLPARTESSPLVVGGSVYFGSEDGTVYALRKRSGAVRWTYRAAGAVKGSPTLHDSVLFFGDYEGEVHAIRASSGQRVWSTGTNGSSFGRSGTFYSTAALAYGRVYIGNTDGRMYSFVERTGKLAWATGTGNYVYASPAVANVPGLGPTVYAGSYDGTFYAFNARTGGVRWSYAAGGRISGSATIVGRVVYFANLGNRSTVGLNTRTGRRVFAFHDGGFDPVIADTKRIYLTGYSSLYALEPRHRGASARPHRTRRHRSRRKR